MNAIGLRIKRLRSGIGYTQEQMAARINLSLRAWQKIEHGITKLDVERLNQIAKILETSVVDLINADEGTYVHQEIEKNENIYNKEVTYNNGISDAERDLYKKIIADKDQEIAFLRGALEKK